MLYDNFIRQLIMLFSMVSIAISTQKKGACHTFIAYAFLLTLVHILANWDEIQSQYRTFMS